MAFLEVKGISFSIDKKTLLRDIAFSVEEGSITLIAGRNGSGKSLLLKLLKGLETQSSGTIEIEGRALRAKERMRTFGLVFQETALQLVGATVERDIAFGAENLGYSRALINERVDSYLELFNLSYAKTLSPRILSGGEKRKLSIAGVLIMDARIVLLDEPFANLDYPSTLTMIDTLKKLKENNITTLIVSHEAEKFLALTDRTIILREGAIVSDRASRESMDALRGNMIYLPKNAKFEELLWQEL